ncbi:hypothetical protein N7541_009512 [Penicillium brevicompactum]|uniref:C2H2-type domain-containing protein n=1 Tax=Penicillium brevicompactum TaxID=5074 RepID=A0A9W9QSY5_PENBR|nr:hypothetical protein N7541_009512 [Penicillium brevicompactum]
MDSTYNMAPTSVQGQPSFAYYPDPTNQQEPLYSPQPMINMLQMATTTAFRGANMLTPIGSPQPTQMKPSRMVQGSPAFTPIDTRFIGDDLYAFPSTAPLSSSRSSISSSPSAHGMLATPIHDIPFAFDQVEGVKEGCEIGVHRETLTNPGWARTESPPMTSVFIYPPSITQTSDFLSATSYSSPPPSPSLVPNSLPAPRSLSDSFCEPHRLTVEPSVNVPAQDLPPLPILSCEEEETPALVGSAYVMLPLNENPSPYFRASSQKPLSSLPKRQCTTYSVEDDGFLSEHSYEDSDVSETLIPNRLPSFEWSQAAQPQVESEEDPEQFKTRKRNVRNSRKAAHDEAQACKLSESSHSDCCSDDSSVDADCSGPAAISVNRRGSKQSLTDDPSRNFICTLCSRRFRRLEHLKRHYRSLHTQDKPFECDECCKSFSRSDNLAQHARTHGAGFAIIGVPDTSDSGSIPYNCQHDAGPIGNVKCDAQATDVGGSSSDRRATKKRKRDLA